MRKHRKKHKEITETTKSQPLITASILSTTYSVGTTHCTKRNHHKQSLPRHRNDQVSAVHHRHHTQHAEERWNNALQDAKASETITSTTSKRPSHSRSPPTPYSARRGTLEQRPLTERYISARQSPQPLRGALGRCAGQRRLINKSAKPLARLCCGSLCVCKNVRNDF